MPIIIPIEETSTCTNLSSSRNTFAAFVKHFIWKYVDGFVDDVCMFWASHVCWPPFRPQPALNDPYWAVWVACRYLPGHIGICISIRSIRICLIDDGQRCWSLFAYRWLFISVLNVRRSKSIPSVRQSECVRLDSIGAHTQQWKHN